MRVCELAKVFLFDEYQGENLPYAHAQTHTRRFIASEIGRVRGNGYFPTLSIMGLFPSIFANLIEMMAASTVLLAFLC